MDPQRLKRRFYPKWYASDDAEWRVKAPAPARRPAERTDAHVRARCGGFERAAAGPADPAASCARSVPHDEAGLSGDSGDDDARGDGYVDDPAEPGCAAVEGSMQAVSDANANSISSTETRGGGGCEDKRERGAAAAERPGEGRAGAVVEAEPAPEASQGA